MLSRCHKRSHSLIGYGCFWTFGSFSSFPHSHFVNRFCMRYVGILRQQIFEEFFNSFTLLRVTQLAWRFQKTNWTITKSWKLIQLLFHSIVQTFCTPSVSFFMCRKNFSILNIIFKIITKSIRWLLSLLHQMLKRITWNHSLFIKQHLKTKVIDRSTKLQPIYTF